MNVLVSLVVEGRSATLVALLALTAAFLSAVATIFARQGLRGSDPYTGAWVNMIVGAVGLWVCVIVTGGVGEVSSRSLLLFTAAGLFGTIGGRLTRFLAISKVGAPVSAAVSSLTPLIATFLTSQSDRREVFCFGNPVRKIVPGCPPRSSSPSLARLPR